MKNSCINPRTLQATFMCLVLALVTPSALATFITIGAKELIDLSFSGFANARYTREIRETLDGNTGDIQNKTFTFDNPVVNGSVSVVGDSHIRVSNVVTTSSQVSYTLTSLDGRPGTVRLKFDRAAPNNSISVSEINGLYALTTGTNTRLSGRPIIPFDIQLTVPGNWSNEGTTSDSHIIRRISPSWTIDRDFTFNGTNTIFQAHNDLYDGSPASTADFSFRLFGVSTKLHPIVFVPGIMGSKLADGNKVEIWPTGITTSADEKFRRLVLPAQTQANVLGATELMDEAQAGVNIYKSWIKRLNGELKGKWVPVPYDWRYNPQQLAYTQTDTQGVLVRVRRKLSQHVIDAVKKAYDDTGVSVLIVSHSMGNFLVKEALRQEPELANKVFGIVFVAAPQAGSAGFVETVLHGKGDSLSDLMFWTGISPEDVRGVALTLPGLYMNGPTEKYFFLTGTPPPVIRFGDDGDCNKKVISPEFKKLCKLYGGEIKLPENYSNFMKGSERSGFLATEADVVARTNLTEPAALSTGIFEDVKKVHEAIDDPSKWNPRGLPVFQIVGTNVPTNCGIQYYEVLYTESYIPPAILQRQEQIPCPGPGDGTVISQSAELTPSQTTTYVDLVKNVGCDYEHADIMESKTVQNLILKLAGSDVSNANDDCNRTSAAGRTTRYIQITVYSPVRFSVTDSDGQVTGDFPDGNVREEIPGSRFGSLTGGRYIRLEADKQYRFDISGTDNGFAGLRISLFETDGQRLDTVDYVAFPVVKDMRSSLPFSDSRDFWQLPIDLDNNGSVDVIVQPNEHFDPLEALQMIKELLNLKVDAGGPKTALLAQVENALRGYTDGKKGAQVIKMMEVFRKQLDVFQHSELDNATKSSLISLSELVIRSQR